MQSWTTVADVEYHMIFSSDIWKYTSITAPRNIHHHQLVPVSTSLTKPYYLNAGFCSVTHNPWKEQTVMNCLKACYWNKILRVPKDLNTNTHSIILLEPQVVVKIFRQRLSGRYLNNLNNCLAPAHGLFTLRVLAGLWSMSVQSLRDKELLMCPPLDGVRVCYVACSDLGFQLLSSMSSMLFVCVCVCM